MTVPINKSVAVVARRENFKRALVIKLERLLNNYSLIFLLQLSFNASRNS